MSVRNQAPRTLKPAHSGRRHRSGGLLTRAAPGLLAVVFLVIATAGSQVAAEDKPALEVGEAMVDFGLRRLDLNSGTLSSMVWLSDYAGAKAKQPHKLVLLNFFATWCKPCMKEVDALSTWQTKYGERGLQVIAVNYRMPDESWENAVAQTLKVIGPKHPTYPLLFDKFTNRNQLAYMGSRGTLPCNVLLDGKTGTIVARFQGAAETELGGLERAIMTHLEVAP